MNITYTIEFNGLQRRDPLEIKAVSTYDIDYPHKDFIKFYGVNGEYLIPKSIIAFIKIENI